MVKRITKEANLPSIPSLSDFPAIQNIVNALPTEVADLPVTTGVSITLDGCNAIFEVNAVNRFGYFPTSPLRYRNPFCRERKPLKLPPNPNTENGTETFSYPPLKGDISAFIGIFAEENYSDGNIDDNIFYNHNWSKVELIDFENPVNFGDNNDGCVITLRCTYGYDILTGGSLEPEKNTTVTQFTYYIHKLAGEDERNENLVFIDRTNVPSNEYLWIYRLYAPINSGFGGDPIAAVVLTLGGVQHYVPSMLNSVIFTNENVYGQRNDFIWRSQLEKSIENDVRTIEIRYNGNFDFDIAGIYYFHDTSRLFFRNFRNDVILLPSSESLPIAPPTPPEDNMGCCPNVRENDELLRLILQRIGKPLNVQIRDYDERTKGYQPQTVNQNNLFNAAKINTDRVEVANDLIGISEYPIKAPKTIIEDYKLNFPESIDDLWGIYNDAEEDVDLYSLTQFLNWQVEQESAVMGGWHQIIEYEKDGKKEIVRLSNIAETLKELIVLQAGQNKDNSLIVDLLLRVMTELLQTKASTIRTNYIVEDIQDWLDYPTNEKAESYPISISLPEKGAGLERNENVERFLKMSFAQLRYQDWTGKQSFHDMMLDLLQAAAIVRAALSESGEELVQFGKFADGAIEGENLNDFINE